MSVPDHYYFIYFLITVRNRDSAICLIDLTCNALFCCFWFLLLLSKFGGVRGLGRERRVTFLVALFISILIYFGSTGSTWDAKMI